MMQNKIKRIFYVLILLVGLVPALPASPMPLAYAQQPSDWSWLSPDLDGDGLPNDVEINGWCNTLGCFQTDPADPDSDGDGLTDGEEKLFESNPLNDASPGIFVIYEDAFQTKQYYPWQPYGHKLIARGDDFEPTNPDEIDVTSGHGTDLDAVVVRRGTTFYVGGRAGATLGISKSRSSLTTLTPSRDPYTGMWRVSVPSNGSVGKYTLSLGDRSLDLFVIFQLPNPSGALTQGGIDRFVYDDDPSLNRDNLSIVLGDARYDFSYGFVAEGVSYAFYNQQYNRYLLEEYVIDAINGTSSQSAAVDALANAVDRLTVFRNPRVLYDSWTVLHPGTNPRQQCSNVSGLLTAFNRTAGIPTRPVMVDWAISTFDHANEVWLNGQWRVYRGYRTLEMGAYPDNSHSGCGSSSWPACGILRNYDRNSWGQSMYRPWHSGGNSSGNLIVLADHNWTRSAFGVAYRWPSWDIATIKLNPSRLMTQLTEYWSSFGWTQEPVNTGYPGWPTPPPGAAGTGESSALAGATLGLGFQSPQVQLGEVVAEYGLDLNGNGQYDQLVLEVVVTAARAGDYWLLGQLGASQPEPALMGTGGLVGQAWTKVSLAGGAQTVQLVFDGRDISLNRVDGPYVLSGLWVTDVADPGPTEFMNQSLAYRGFLHATAPYRAVDFDTYGALLSGSYSHYDLDQDGDGRSETLVVTTGINAYQSGSYGVEGKLYDNQDQLVSHATWQGAGPEVVLRFEGVAGTFGPYTLRDLRLLDASGQSIDYIREAYTLAPVAGLISPAVASLDVLPAGADELMAMGEVITPTNVFAEALVDGDLHVEAGVQVAQPGSYRLEAWLAEPSGGLVTWAVGQPTDLAAGQQTLSVVFPGQAIRARGLAGPYTVVALKVLAGGAAYQVIDKVDVALTTQAYTPDQFTSSPVTLFDDFVENGGSQWVAGASWTIRQDTYHSPSHAWYASNADASLTLATPLDLSNDARVGLRLQTAYRLAADGNMGYVEASTDGVTWGTLATFSGDAAWSTQIINLGAYAGQPSVYLRFRLASAGGTSDDGWYIDDVLVAGNRLRFTLLPIIMKSR